MAIVCVCVRSGIDACLSVSILHLAHDCSRIHLEGREALNLTDNSFHTVKNRKQTARAGKLRLELRDAVGATEDFTHDHASISDSDLRAARSTRHPLKKISFQTLQSNMRLTRGCNVNNASTLCEPSLFRPVCFFLFVFFMPLTLNGRTVLLFLPSWK